MEKKYYRKKLYREKLHRKKTILYLHREETIQGKDYIGKRLHREKTIQEESIRGKTI